MIGRGALGLLAMLQTASAAARITDDALVLQVRAALVHHHLAPRPQCLLYRVTRNSEAGIDRVDVSAKHDVACGGDPALDEHLFSVFIDQKTHQMGTDAGDRAGGTLKVLPP